jgi:hypothetical protein
MKRNIISTLVFIFLPTGILIAFVSSCWLSAYLFSMKFTYWKSLGAPPSGTEKIVEVDRNDVWVEAKNGELFTLTLRCDKNELCKKWVKVESAEELNVDNFTTVTRSEICSELVEEDFPQNPKGSTTECVLASYYGPEYDIKTYYALMSDGSIEYWHHERGGYADILLFGILFVLFTSIVILMFFKIHKKVLADEKAG